MQCILFSDSCRLNLHFFRIVAWIFLLILLPLSFALAVEGDPAAEPFSDPDRILPAGDEMINKPVVHDPAVKNYDLTINLDQASSPLFREVVEEFGRDKQYRIFVNSGTCGVSNRKLLEKSFDAASFCCPPGENDRFPWVTFHTLAIAPLAVIVHQDNSLESISLDEARQVFMGKIRRWSELKDAKGRKGFSNPIQPVIFPHCKERPGHWRMLLKSHEMFSTAALSVASLPDMVFTVSSNKRSIGYELPWIALTRYREKGVVKVVRIDQMDPRETEFMIRNQYPLYRALYLAIVKSDTKAGMIAEELKDYLVGYIEKHAGQYNLVSVAALRKAGWKFREGELTGPPDK